MYLVRLSSVLGIDLNEAVTRKLVSNGQKYPVDKARSNSKSTTDSDQHASKDNP